MTTCSKYPSARKSGFTLVEIMVAVMIIAILSAVAGVAFRATRKTFRLKQAESEVEILAAAIRQLAWDTGEWPAGIQRNITGNAETWNLAASSAGLLGNDGRFDNWEGPYIMSIEDDPWGNPYFFDPDYSIGGKMKAVVGSFGPNGRGRNVYDSDNIYVILKE